ncbi:hypothetical protein [Cyanobium sp. CH-040]|uniref:hypothetical protein n=1 Tax=Cyanobium sp. CH-040 TaxID=2823708 RepID=UPI0020CCD399|nr:hypothetical protein [Cyanobium sp. CH-040]MCP9927222.1 hypothetical protein [Cyanobium sp. CH-040]
MQRPIPWFWILLALLLLLAPGPAGRFLIDLLGSITLLLLVLPLLLGVAGFVGWQILRRRLRTCEVCGFSSLDQEVCPACGTSFAASSPQPSADVAAADATIDVEVVEVKDQSP